MELLLFGSTSASAAPQQAIVTSVTTGNNLLHYLMTEWKHARTGCIEALLINMRATAPTYFRSACMGLNHTGSSVLHKVCQNNTLGAGVFDLCALLVDEAPQMVYVADQQGCLPLHYAAQQPFGGQLLELLAFEGIDNVCTYHTRTQRTVTYSLNMRNSH